ncbi:MAG: ribosome maturation factor RimM [Ktedonobacterales bacterium]
MAKNNQPNTSSGGDSGDSDWVTVGHVVGVFGVHGEIKVEPYTSFPERFAETHTVCAGTSHTPYRILGAHPHKHHILLQLEGIADIDAAERLRGQALAIPASEIHHLPEDHFYLHDVIGLAVLGVNGRKIGTVKDVLVTGGTDLFVIERAESGQDVLLPAVKEFIKSIDITAGVVEVDPIPGLLDDDFDTAL